VFRTVSVSRSSFFFGRKASRKCRVCFFFSVQEEIEEFRIDKIERSMSSPPPRSQIVDAELLQGGVDVFAHVHGELGQFLVADFEAGRMRALDLTLDA
jgi:hypothetical protein